MKHTKLITATKRTQKRIQKIMEKRGTTGKFAFEYDYRPGSDLIMVRALIFGENGLLLDVAEIELNSTGYTYDEFLAWVEEYVPDSHDKSNMLWILNNKYGEQ